MAVISGILKDPIGGPRVGVAIELRSVRTSATVVNQARSQSITDAAGKYTLTVGGYMDIHHAVRDIGEWIQGYYNTVRPHRRNGGLPPCEYEEQWKKVTKVP
jgi:transposase InsO family protein